MPTEPADIRCPFNEGAEKNCIWCEGIVNKSTIRIKFKDARDRLKHQHIFCQEIYKNCEIYRAIMSAKYDGDA